MTANEALSKHLSSLPRHIRVAKSRDIRESLGISKFVLSDWCTGRTPIPRLSFREISKILGEDFDADVEF